MVSDFHAKIKNTLISLCLPDTCAVCGCSLGPGQYKDSRIPLCSGCYSASNNELLRIRFPDNKFCRKCGYPLTSELNECVPCRDRTRNFDSSAALFSYSGIGKSLIRAYKFDNRKNLAFFFAKLVYSYYITHEFDSVIIPVPYRPSSKKRRGWDQIYEITSILEKHGLKIDCCLKRDNGPAQKTMNYQKRMLNLDNKIHLKSSKPPPVSVLLIDDVFTTGATLDCCAKTLKNAGTYKVDCLALAIDL